MNITPNQPTFPQVLSFLELLNKQKLTTQQFQNVLENGDLVKAVLNCSNLSLVDRSVFSALLKPKPKLTIPWTPKNQFVSKIMDRSKLRGWGFTLADSKKLAKNILKHDHLGDLQPTSLKVWLGKDLKFNYSELLLWIKDEVEKLGKKLKEHDDYMNRLTFLAGSEISGEKFLDVCDLDLQAFWDKVNGTIFKDVKSCCKTLPSLEVLVLLALNPQVYIMMDGETVPYLVAPGFVIDSDRLLFFDYGDGGEACVAVSWSGNRWHSWAVVAFREC